MESTEGEGKHPQVAGWIEEETVYVFYPEEMLEEASFPHRLEQLLKLLHGW